MVPVLERLGLRLSDDFNATAAAVGEVDARGRVFIVDGGVLLNERSRRRGEGEEWLKERIREEVVETPEREAVEWTMVMVGRRVGGAE